MGYVTRGKQINLKIVYPYENPAPYFVTPISSGDVLTVFEEDQVNGYLKEGEKSDYQFYGFNRANYIIGFP